MDYEHIKNIQKSFDFIIDILKEIINYCRCSDYMSHFRLFEIVSLICIHKIFTNKSRQSFAFQTH